MHLRKHGESDFVGVTKNIHTLHSRRLITISNYVEGFLLLFWSHGVPENWQAQVPIDIVGLGIELEGVPCLEKWLNIIDPFFELNSPSCIKVACSVLVHPYPWAYLRLENGTKSSR